LYRALLEQGFLAGYKPAANLLRFYPPLVLERNQVNQFVESLGRVLLWSESA
jgi:4-aminobutyrate aminotransferase-like enzyme